MEDSPGRYLERERYRSVHGLRGSYDLQETWEYVRWFED